MSFGVESANIVGYSQASLRTDFKAGGACFVPVSGSTIDLNDLKVVGYSDICEGDVNVQILDSLGRGGEVYFWYDVPEFELYGWLDGSDELVEDGVVTLAPGEGLWINAPGDGYGLQSAGQVPTSDVAVVLRSDFKLVVNPTPVTIDLTNVAITGYSEICEGDVNVQILDSLGRGGEVYFWYDVPEFELYGWLDGSDEPVEVGAVTLGSGEGLWANATSSDYMVVFPGVTL